MGVELLVEMLFSLFLLALRWVSLAETERAEEVVFSDAELKTRFSAV